MSDSFDPYYTWLGIRPEQQPPNHYRLLGLQLFEGNVDAIEHAADRQMAHLRTLQTGQHAALSQRLLNEVAAARLCLLSPAEKTAYDATLWKQVAEQTTARGGAPVAQPGVTPPMAILVEKSPTARPSSLTWLRRRRSPFFPIVAAFLAIAVVTSIVWGVLWGGRFAAPVPLPAPVTPAQPTAASTANRSSLPAQKTLPLGEWTDLLPQLDLPGNVVCGPWEQQEEAIHVGSYSSLAEQGLSRIMLPATLMGNYDLEVEIVCEKPHAWAAVLLPVGSQRCTLLLGVDEKVALALVDGRVVSGSPLHRVEPSATRRPSVVRVGVRLDGAQATIDALVDGKPLLQWTGPQRSLSTTANWALPAGSWLGLGGVQTTFHRVRVRPSSDPTSATSAGTKPAHRPPEKAVPGEHLPVGQWVDLLPYADVAWGRVWGKWERRGEEIVAQRALWVAGKDHPRLGLPVEIEGNYDLQVEFTRTEDVNMVGIVLPVGSRRATVVFDEGASNEKAAGIEPIDGLGARNNPTAKRSTGFLTNGQRYVVLCHVCADGQQVQIDVSLNDQPFLHWADDQKRLGTSSAWTLPGPHSVGLVASASAVTFHAVRLRLVSGKATRVDTGKKAIP